MDKLVYVAMTGARQTLQAQAAIAENLANASTPGFRANFHAFQSRPIDGPGFPSRVNAVTTDSGWNFAPGPVQATNEPLDVAVQGSGWIAVQADDGSEAYTRAGNLRLGTGGLLTTATGLPVLGNDGPIALPPFEEIVIGDDGTISMVPLGQEASTLATVDRIKLVDPPVEDLHKDLDGMIRARDPSQEILADASVRVKSGTLEGSNVNVAEVMVSMLQLARQFELQVKMMETAQDNAARAERLVQMS